MTGQVHLWLSMGDCDKSPVTQGEGNLLTPPLITHFSLFFPNSRATCPGCWEILLKGVHNVQNPWVLSTAHIVSNCHVIRLIFHYPHSREFLASVALQDEPILDFLSYLLLSFFSLRFKNLKKIFWTLWRWVFFSWVAKHCHLKYLFPIFWFFLIFRGMNSDIFAQLKIPPCPQPTWMKGMTCI